MIKLQVQIDQVDYDRIFNAYYAQAKEILSESEEPAATLIARVPEAMAKQIWNGLNTAQKEKIVAGLLQSKAGKYIPEVEQKLHENQIDLRVKQIEIKSDL